MPEGNVRTFGVLIEYRLPGGGIDRDVEFIDFTYPEADGPDRTLAGIAQCRVETKLLQNMAAEHAGKNWRIVKVDEATI